MSIEKKIFASRIYTADNDLTKRWFISVKVPNYKKGTFIWRKCYGDINKFNTLEERHAEINRLHQLIQETQTYVVAQGSRAPGYTYEGFHTDTIFQFKKQLEYRKHRVRHSTYRKYASDIRNLEAWLVKNNRANLPVGAFTINDAHLFLNHVLETLKLSNVSYNAHLRLFKSFFDELVTNEIVKLNPFAAIKGLSKQTTPALYFSKQQIDLLKIEIPKADLNLWHFVQFIYYCFIRPGELRKMKIADINFDEQKIMVRPEISKNKRMQWVSIPVQLGQTIKEMKLQEHPEEFYIFGKYNIPGPDMVGTNRMKISHQAILKGLNFNIRHKLYSWKHTGAVACARAGMNLKDLQMQLRHHSLDQVNVYLNSMLVYESDFIKNKFPEL